MGDGLNPADVALIERIQQATHGASRLLCTLARRGKGMERDEGRRAAGLLAAVRTHPLYKGGRLAFDMLEIEDLMLDGSSVEPMSTREVIRVLSAGADRLVETLRGVGSPSRDPRSTERSPVDSGVAPETAPVREGGFDDATSTLRMPRVRLGPADGSATLGDAAAAHEERADARQRELELQASDYLYDFAVLGLLDVLGSRTRDAGS